MNILLTIPVSPAHPYVHKNAVFALLKIMNDKKHSVHVSIPAHNPFENNLHHIVNDFVKGDYDYWLSFDFDNPPIKNPLDVIELDKDIVGFPTPVWHFTGKEKNERPVYYNAYDYVKEKDAYRPHEIMNGLQKVDAIGTGCFLIARRVFEHPEMRKAPFQRTYNIDGTVNKGNDIAFSERAYRNGFTIYAHYDYPCMHFNEIELNEVVRAFKGLYE